MRLRFFGLLSLSLLTVGLTGLVAPVVHADEGETQAGYNDITNKGGPWVHIHNFYGNNACSGTLLTPQKVITARHCSAVQPDGRVRMLVSSNFPRSSGCFGQATLIVNGVKISEDEPCLTEVNVVAVNQHPTEDIAILTLKHALPGTYPAKLARYDANLLARQTRAGWNIPVRMVGARSVDSPNDHLGMFYGDGLMRSFGCGSRCSGEATYYRGLTRYATDVYINHNPIYTNIPFWPGDSGGGIFRNEELIGVATHRTSGGVGEGPAITDAVRAWMNQVGVFNPMQYTYPDGTNNGGSASNPAPAPAPTPAKPAPTSPWASKPLPQVAPLSFPYRKQVSVSRIAGSDRVKTSLALFDRVADKSVAVLATGRDFPDGLVGGNLAGVLKSGVILTMGDALEPDILAALRDNGTKKVYVVGGESAVSTSKEFQLQQNGIETVRLAGEDRFKTAEKIKDEVRSVLKIAWLGPDSASFQASGTDYPDALAAAAVAGRVGGTMKLSHPNIWAYGGVASDRYFCVGGHGCAHNAEEREQIVGANRYDTAYKLTELQPFNGVALVVSGKNFPDALAASGLAASLDADLILSDGKRANLPSNVNRVILVGGSAVLPDSIEYYTR